MQYSNELDQKQTNLVYFAKLSFILLLFYTFIGFDLPFKGKVTDVDEIVTSSIVGQAVFIIIFLTSTISLIPYRTELYELLKKEKYLTLFLLWCLLSIGWSEFGFVSFKRWIKILSIYTSCLAVVLNYGSNLERMKHFKYIVYPYLIISIISVLFIPGAIDFDFGTWRGIAHTKNLLGQASLMCIILCYIYFRFANSIRGKCLVIPYLVLSLTLLIGSQSATALLSFVFFIVVGSILWLDKLSETLGIGHIFVFLVALTVLGIIGLIVYLDPDIIVLIPEAFGKDMSFTGRIDLWEYIFNQSKEHLFIGAGFDGFWVMENENLMNFYRKIGWFPFQAHNGYLDILNETGLVGLFLFFMMIIHYFINLINHKTLHPWKWIIIIVLIMNFMETSLFRPKLLYALFVFSYLSLYWEKEHPNPGDVDKDPKT
jgi:O-antigen ligase